MFTGLITHRAKIIAKEANADGDVTLALANPFSESEPISVGESIAVNGCCLTVLGAEQAEQECLRFFISEETLSLTTFGSLNSGARVNLERALQSGERLGGHIVSGHIDCIGIIENRESASGSTCITIGYPAEHGALLIPKGSVTVDGVSLTVNSLCDDSGSSNMRRFTVNIIPHTNEQTGFSELQVGDKVNLEFDMFAKFALRQSSLDSSLETSIDRGLETVEKSQQNRPTPSHASLAEEKYV